MKKNKSIIPILLVVAIVLFAGIFGVLKLTENTDGVGKAEKKLQKMISRINPEETELIKSLRLWYLYKKENCSEEK